MECRRSVKALRSWRARSVFAGSGSLGVGMADVFQLGSTEGEAPPASTTCGRSSWGAPLSDAPRPTELLLRNNSKITAGGITEDPVGATSLR
ncbi:hypothetical protein GCM10028783_42960 [Modestobacter muralis]